MSRKITLALMLAVVVGVGSAAQAGSDNQSDPTRGFAYGPKGQRVGGRSVNPADHLSTQPGGPYAYAASPSPRTGIDDRIMSDGKCWENTSNGNYGWAACPKSRR
jgi:hypothetical protein